MGSAKNDTMHALRHRVEAAVLLLLVGVELPYGLAFKLIAVSGLVTLPGAVALLARNIGAPHPIPGLAAVGTLGFMIDQSYTIVGGNFYATMAGEFYFSMALSLVILGLAFAARGLRHGGFQAVSAALIAAGVLCHIAIAVVFLPVMAISLLWIKPTDLGWRAWFAGSARWFGWVAGVVALLSAVWLLPFLQFHGYLNNMGLGKEEGYSLWLVDRLSYGRAALFSLTAMAAVGGFVYRRAFFLWSVSIAVLGAVLFVVLPGGVLWNPRVLPLYSLGLYLGAVCGLWTVVSLVSGAVRTEMNRRADERERTESILSGVRNTGVAAVALIAVILPMQLIPGSSEQAADPNPVPGTTAFAHLKYGPLSVPSFSPRGWAEYNFSGFEAKPGWAEYRDLMETMKGVGIENGCGPAMWEYDASLTRFGPPMALMLVPYFTDHCVGSMEGLYFEASQTTPFHFMLQDAVSPAPSRAQRNVPYRGLDVARGVQYMQELGTQYAMLHDPNVIAAAEENPDMELVAESGDWRIFKVLRADLVVPLEFEPVVLKDYPTDTLEWLDAATAYFAEPRAWPQTVVERGPEGWRRYAATDIPERKPINDPPEVSNVQVGSESLSFDVSRTGEPIRIRTSYFPLWNAAGADGPYRSFPNQMIVVPTDTHVELSYGRSSGEMLGWFSFVIGLALLAARGVWAEEPLARRLRAQWARRSGPGSET
jgi:hypothetical protein